MDIEEVRRNANPVISGDLDSFIAEWGFPLYIEIKRDGERCWIEKSKSGIMYAWNKHNTMYQETTHVNLFNQYRNIGNSFILEGELCSKNGGIYSYLSNRMNGKDLVFHPFDVLLYDNVHFRDLNLGARKARLKASGIHDGIYFEVKSKIDILAAFNYITKELSQEGIVIKSPKQPYGSPWLKIKRETTIDAVILGIRKSEHFILDNIARSYKLGVFTTFRDWQWIGDVGSGLNIAEKEALTRVLEASKYYEDDGYILTRPLYVLEIIAESKSEDGHLISPRMRRIRHDKAPEDCNIKQMDLLPVKK